MSGVDLGWVALGVFLLACGGLPAVLAMREETRRPALPELWLFHEAVDGLSPAAMARAGSIGFRPVAAGTLPVRVPAWAGMAVGLAIPPGAIPPGRVAPSRPAPPAHPRVPGTWEG